MLHISMFLETETKTLASSENRANPHGGVPAWDKFNPAKLNLIVSVLYHYFFCTDIFVTIYRGYMKRELSKENTLLQ